MVGISALWLPIVLTPIIIFILSALIHRALPLHKNDYRQLPQEETVLATLRAAGATPGPVYHFPFPTHAETKSSEMMEKFKRGPVGIMILVRSGPPSKKYLAQWFLYSVVVTLFVAYLSGHTLNPGRRYSEVFLVACITAFLGYAGAAVQDSIYKGQPWGVSLKHVFDALIYALITGGIFGWLWPR
jgi:hypothetical protein